MKIFHKWFYSLHPGKIRLSLAVVLAFLIFLPFVPSSGKVFWGRFLTKGVSTFDPSGNWRQIYKCPMIINGAPASLSVYGCDDSLQSVIAKLKRNFSSNKNNYFIGPGFRRRSGSYGGQVAGGSAEARNENSAWMLSAVHNQVSCLLMLAMPDSDKSVIFEFCRQPDEFSKPPALPSESAVFGQSLPAESTLTAIIKNEETGATLETLSSAAPPERVINELSEHLSRNGWKNILPAGNQNASRQYFQIYQRGHAICTVMVGQALRENKTCVTILYKETKGQLK